jgi:hypothetical protein
VFSRLSLLSKIDIPWFLNWGKTSCYTHHTFLLGFPMGWVFPTLITRKHSLTKIRSPFKTLYFYCFMHYVLFLELLYFCFQFYFGLFAIINGWIMSCSFWRRCTHFSFAKNTLIFTLFLLLRLAFIFCLNFCLDLVLSLNQGVFGPLVYVGIDQKGCFKKVRMVLEKRKKFHAK